MGMDVCRYIEVYTPDFTGYVHDKKYLEYIGKFKVGDIIMIYNDYSHYWKITNIDNGVLTYEPVVYAEVDDDESLKKYSDFVDSLNIVYRCEYINDLPKTQLSCKEGDIYKYWDSGEKYVKYTNGEWVNIDSCPYSWKPIVWEHNGKKENYIASGCSCFINNYISRYSDSTGSFMGFSCRGLPKDVTEETKKSISEYDFDHTYLTLDELTLCCNDILKNVKNRIYNCIIDNSNSIVQKKLDIIIEKLFNNKDTRNMANEEDDNCFGKETLNNYLEELLSEYEIANNEYVRISTIVENMYGYISDKNIRVIYTFNN